MQFLQRRSLIFYLTFFKSSCAYNPEISKGVFVNPPMQLPSCATLEEDKRVPSFPYVAGENFRKLAKFKIDEARIPLHINQVQDGDIIFLSTSLQSYFFTYIHPQLTSQYILITHHGDDCAPGIFKSYLDDNKLIAWFGINCDIPPHPKFCPIPYGIFNSCWPFGNLITINNSVMNLKDCKKDYLLYANFSPATNPKVREPLFKYFENKSWIFKPSFTVLYYFDNVARSKFVLSPHGNGLDCIRTWEALIMGSIPIVKTSTLDPLYEDLPVLIVDDWLEITEKFLEEKYIQMSKKTYKMEKAYGKYWIDKIVQCQKNFYESLKKTEHA